MSAAEKAEETVAAAAAAEAKPAEPAPAAAAAAEVPEEVGETEDDQTNLIINYLPQYVTEARLREMFGKFGEVEHVKLMLDKVTGASMGYGFVKYAKPESAAEAISAMNGFQMDQKKLRVSYSHPRTEANVYVGNLKPSVTKEQLEKLFQRYGSIIECKILMDHESGVSKGCGFVKFENVNDAKDAIAGCSGADLPEYSQRPLTVKFARKHEKPHHPHYPMQHHRFNPNPRPSQPAEYTGYCLFIYNLPQNTTNDDLRTAFGRYGTITSANVKLDYNGTCRGFGFVNFEKKEDAEKAIEGMNNMIYKNRTLKVSFKEDKRQ